MVSSWDRLLTSLQPAFQGTQTEAVSLSLTQSQESYSITSVGKIWFSANHEDQPKFNGRGMHLHLPPEGGAGKITMQKSTCQARFCCNHIWKVKFTKYHDFNCYKWMKRATEQRTWDWQHCFFHSKAMWFYFLRCLICVMQADLFLYDFQCYDLGHTFCGIDYFFTWH